MEWVRDDGGRAEAGYTGKAGDCVVRAVAIATGLPYQDVYDALSTGARNERQSTARSARDGIHVKRLWFKRYMESLDWKWTPTMSIGSGCKVHLRAEELPAGRLVVSLSKHYAAVVDGVIHDEYDPSRDGTRCVYGYWSQAAH